MVRRFTEVWEAKDVQALIRVPDPDATAVADGGGLVSAELRPIEGAVHVARACVDVAAWPRAWRCSSESSTAGPAR